MDKINKHINQAIKSTPTIKCDVCGSVKPSIRIKLLDKIVCLECKDKIIKAGFEALDIY